MKKQIGIFVGTRPEVIKMAPVYRAMKASSILEPILISTGQHRQMLDQALNAFELIAHHDLELMTPGQTLSELTAKIIRGTSDLLKMIRPDAILVQGDTTTVLGSALAAFYENIPIGHVEAGLRTYRMDSPWPEEMNRRLVAPLCKWCFAPTEWSAENLRKEKIDNSAIFVTGNTVVDSLLWVKMAKADRNSIETVAQRCSLCAAFVDKHLRNGGPWILVTGHRRESFGGGFEDICQALLKLSELYPEIGILYPVHLNPNVQEPVKRLLGNRPNIHLILPVGYEDFVWLMMRCYFAISDSGGVQEEAPSLGKPVLVMRETTERPEGVRAGTCELVGTTVDGIVDAATRLLDNRSEYCRRSALRNPYGDGNASVRIVGVLENSFS
jgi:UDP-N-acetylglucosamine 2-epimerase (non-hydrolysing)